MQTETTLNANLANCLVTKNHFGFDVIINICNGRQQTIPWTFGDWAGFAGLSCLGLLLAAAVIGLICLLVSSLRDGY